MSGTDGPEQAGPTQEGPEERVEAEPAGAEGPGNGGTAPETPGARRPRARLLAWSIAAAAAAVVLTLAVVRSPEEEAPTEESLIGTVADARIEDPHPVGRPVTGIHPDCGVPEGTVRALAGVVRPTAPISFPEADLERRCVWQDDGGAVLDVEVRVFEAQDDDPDRAAAAGVRGLSDLLTWETREHPDAQVIGFTGLGEQAYLVHGARGVHRQEDTLGTAVVFRSAGTVVRVAHRGEAPEPPPGPDWDGGEGAAVAATAIADGLGAATGPFALLDHGPESRTEPPGACPDLEHPMEPERSTEAYLVGEAYLTDAEVPQVSCEWPGPDHITVDTALLPTAADAHGEYLHLFHGRRAAPQPDGADDPAPGHLFVPLAGPGDEAFAVYTDDVGREAEVVFRDGGLLVRVTVREYTSAAGPEPGETLDRAYGFAEEAARSSRS